MTGGLNSNDKANWQFPGRVNIEHNGRSLSGAISNSSPSGDTKSTGGRIKQFLNKLLGASSINVGNSSSLSSIEYGWFDINGDGLSDQLFYEFDEEGIEPAELFVILNLELQL